MADKEEPQGEGPSAPWASEQCKESKEAYSASVLHHCRDDELYCRYARRAVCLGVVDSDLDSAKSGCFGQIQIWIQNLKRSNPNSSFEKGWIQIQMFRFKVPLKQTFILIFFNKKVKQNFNMWIILSFIFKKKINGNIFRSDLNSIWVKKLILLILPVGIQIPFF